MNKDNLTLTSACSMSMEVYKSVSKVSAVGVGGNLYKCIHNDNECFMFLQAGDIGSNSLAAHYFTPSAAGKPSLGTSGFGADGSLGAGLENSTFNMNDLYHQKNKVSLGMVN